MVSVSLSSWLEVTIDYLLFLPDYGCSGSLDSQHLSGVAFYFKLLGGCHKGLLGHTGYKRL